MPRVGVCVVRVMVSCIEVMLEVGWTWDAQLVFLEIDVDDLRDAYLGIKYLNFLQSNARYWDPMKFSIIWTLKFELFEYIFVLYHKTKVCAMYAFISLNSIDGLTVIVSPYEF